MGKPTAPGKERISPGIKAENGSVIGKSEGIGQPDLSPFVESYLTSTCALSIAWIFRREMSICASTRERKSAPKAFATTIKL